MSFFTSSDFTTGQKLLEVIYIVIGLITLYTGIKNARDKENPSRFGTALFWCTLGVVLAFGRWISPKAVGVLVLIMTIPAVFKKVKIGKVDAPSEESMKAMFEKSKNINYIDTTVTLRSAMTEENAEAIDRMAEELCR